jgi:putative NIF3 family GTP cyclohydrolase 1 type 2
MHPRPDDEPEEKRAPPRRKGPTTADAHRALDEVEENMLAAARAWVGLTTAEPLATNEELLDAARGRAEMALEGQRVAMDIKSAVWRLCGRHPSEEGVGVRFRCVALLRLLRESQQVAVAAMDALASGGAAGEAE